MLHPLEIQRQLGFDKILERLTGRCSTPLGVSEVRNIRFSSNVERLEIEFMRLDEAKKLREEGFPGFKDCSGADECISLLKSAGIPLTPEQFLVLRDLLETFNGWQKFVSEHKDQVPHIHPELHAVDFPEGFYQELDRIFTPDGQVSDSASQVLKKVRKEIRSCDSERQTRLQSIFRSYSAKGFVPDDTSVSIRNGRYVIPVRTSSKRQVPGYHQGESSTGSIAYIEPQEIIELSNQLNELNEKELREINRILAELSGTASDVRKELKHISQVVGRLDFLQAKLEFMLSEQFIIPEIADTTRLLNCYHPVLSETLRSEGKSIIPMSLELHSAQRIVVISGPNAGGKSVALKTVGIVQLMFQHGLPVPAEETSRLRVVKDLILDIGDNQSIENDLSTYSSHLKNMNLALHHAGKDMLFLFDEFGSGTAPGIGGAIAQAVLEILADKGSYGIITTHYDNIKKAANQLTGVFNGAMRFDSGNLEPLFELELGRPGSSFAIEMAKNIGLDNTVLNRASSIIGEDVMKLEDMLATAEREKQDLEKSRKETLRQLKELKQEKERFERLSTKLEEEKNKIMSRAAMEADQLLKDANKEIEKTIRHIKTSKAHKEETKKVRKKIDKKKQQISEVSKSLHKADRISEDLYPGDRVSVVGQSATGVILSVGKKDAEILSGSVTLRVALQKLVKVEGQEDNKGGRILKKAGINLTDKKAAFEGELNIRGMRAEQALVALDKYLDDALLVGRSDFRILHGKGDGILRNLVREQLKKNKFVDMFTDEHADRGGAGVTLVRLK